MSVDEFVAKASGRRVLVRSPQATRRRDLVLGPDVMVSSSEAGVIEVEGLTAEQVGEIAASHQIVLGALYVMLVGAFALGIGAIVRSKAGGIATFAGIFFVLPPLLNIPPQFASLICVSPFSWLNRETKLGWARLGLPGWLLSSRLERGRQRADAPRIRALEARGVRDSPYGGRRSVNERLAEIRAAAKLLGL